MKHWTEYSETLLKEENGHCHLMMEIEDKENPLHNNLPIRIINNKYGKIILGVIANATELQLILANQGLLEKEQITKEFLEKVYLPKINEIAINNPLIDLGQIVGPEFQIILITNNKTYHLSGNGYGDKNKVEEVKQFASSLRMNKILASEPNKKNGKEYLEDMFMKTCQNETKTAYVNDETYQIEVDVIEGQKNVNESLNKPTNDVKDGRSYMINDSQGCYVWVKGEEKMVTVIENIPSIIDGKDDIEFDDLVKKTLPKIIKALQDNGLFIEPCYPEVAKMPGEILILTRNHFYKIDEYFVISEEPTSENK